MLNQQGTAIASSKVLRFPPPTAQPPSPKGSIDLRSGSLVPCKSIPALSGAAKLAHNARNALCSLHLLVGLLEEPGVLAPSARRYAGELGSVADTLTSVLETLTAPTERASMPVATPDPGHNVASIGEVLRSCQHLLDAAAGPWTAVYISSERNLPRLALPDEALRRVLINLAKNAGEAMGTRGGTVRITARRALGRDCSAVLIHISDNGPGIPPRALGQIFEPGFSSKPGGYSEAGFGLTVARKLIESVGGTIRVGSTRRRGTTFELRIPCLAS